MVLQPLRGFRDFYPEDQSSITHFKNTAARVCGLFGYAEIEGPAIESLDLYQAKSSEEIIAEQAFVFDDRGGARVVLRPELTPTLARMVAQRQAQLTFPLRWWSFGRFWRYERPQKGRGREFYQWNCDLIGDDSVDADVEIIELVIRFLQSLGLTEQQVQIELGDRAVINELLLQLGLTRQAQTTAIAALDRATKYSADELATYAVQRGLDLATFQDLMARFNRLDSRGASERLAAVVARLETQKLGGWIVPNLGVVRGFDYYTGLVFEVSARQGNYRALLGGGRYDNLVANVGGQAVSGIGFAAGDMVLIEYLDSLGMGPKFLPTVDAVVIAATEATAWGRKVTTCLRARGVKTVLATSNNLARDLKFAHKQRSPYSVIIGPNEATTQTVIVKNMTSGTQQSLSLNAAAALIGERDPMMPTATP